ncbi:hypothetical protein B8W90_11520, partial [Staphylococcus hominis]
METGSSTPTTAMEGPFASGRAMAAKSTLSTTASCWPRRLRQGAHGPTSMVRLTAWTGWERSYSRMEVAGPMPTRAL